MTATTPPAGLAELLALPLWVNADNQKIPYTPSLAGPKVPAKAGVPATWRHLPDALAAQTAGRFPHVGLQFAEDSPYWCIDGDHCRDAATAQLDPRAQAIIMLANSYAEPSVGGASIHVVVKGPLPRRMVAGGRLGKKQGDWEAYGGRRYLRMSLSPFPGFDTVRVIDQLTADLLYGLMFPEDDAPAVATHHRPAPAPIDLDDAALLDKGFASKGGDDFRRRHEGAYLLANKSDDDYGYWNDLYFWFRGDQPRMRRVALASGRVRDKWFEKRGDTDWLSYDIGRRCREGGEVYDPAAYRHDAGPPPPSKMDAPPDARLLAEVVELRAFKAAVIDLVRAEGMSGTEKITAIGASLEIVSAQSRGEIDADGMTGISASAVARNLHLSRQCVSDVFERWDKWGYMPRETPYSGKCDAKGKPLQETRLRAPASVADAANPARVITDLLVVFSTYRRPASVPKHGGNGNRCPQCGSTARKKTVETRLVQTTVVACDNPGCDHVFDRDTKVVNERRRRTEYFDAADDIPTMVDLDRFREPLTVPIPHSGRPPVQDGPPPAHNVVDPPVTLVTGEEHAPSVSPVTPPSMMDGPPADLARQAWGPASCTDCYAEGRRPPGEVWTCAACMRKRRGEPDPWRRPGDLAAGDDD